METTDGAQTRTLSFGRQRQPRKREETRDIVLDAAEDCFTRYGVDRTTIDDIVRVAGIPRATLYRHAGGKDDLIVGVAIREMERFFAALREHTAQFDTVAESLVEGVLFAVEHFRENDLLAMMLSSDPTAPYLETIAEAGRELMLGFVGAGVHAGQESGQMRSDLTPEDAAEWLMRIIGSLAYVPSPFGRDRDEMRELLHRMLVPAFT